MGVSVITGASAGIGMELSKLFVREGHSTLLIARRQDRLNELASELKKINPNVQTWVLALDLKLPDSAKKIFRFTSDNNLQVDYLVNNAGFGSNGFFSELDIIKELEMIDLNIKSLVELTHLFLPQMLKRKFGKILNVGSTAGFQPGPYMSTYYATKAFVNSFSEALSTELEKTGVTCTVLAPGPTQTEFAQVAKIEDRKLFKMMRPQSAKEVAQYGFDCMMSGASMAVPGVLNKLLIQTLRIAPRAVIRDVVKSVNQI